MPWCCTTGLLISLRLLAIWGHPILKYVLHGCICSSYRKIERGLSLSRLLIRQKLVAPNDFCWDVVPGNSSSRCRQMNKISGESSIWSAVWSFFQAALALRRPFRPKNPLFSNFWQLPKSCCSVWPEQTIFRLLNFYFGQNKKEKKSEENVRIKKKNVAICAKYNLLAF